MSNLQDKGYGPDGSMSRQDWQALCLEKLLAGAPEWNGWQNEINLAFEKAKSLGESSEKVLFGYRVETPKGFESRRSGDHQRLLRTAADFCGQKFCDLGDLSGYTFSVPVTFCGATFECSAGKKAKKAFTAEKVDFKCDVYFDDARFDGDVDFNGSKFKGPAIFDRAEFLRYAGFTNTTFDQICSFAGSKFQRPPAFPNSVCKTGPLFQGATFVEQGYQQLLQDWQIETPAADRELEKSIDRLNVLKKLSEAAGDAAQVLNFNAEELRAREYDKREGYVVRVLTRLYGTFSDFGRSFVCPIRWYFCTMALTLTIALVHACLNAPVRSATEPQSRMFGALDRCLHTADSTPTNSAQRANFCMSGYRAAIEYTLQASTGLTAYSASSEEFKAVTWRLFAQGLEPWSMRLYRVLSTLFTAILLFLIGLGLRNRYRVK